MRFGEPGVIEDDGENLRVPFGEKSAGDASGTTASERDFLSQRKLRKTSEKLVFRDALYLRLRPYGKSELRQVHEIKIADEANSDEARSARMERERPLDAIVS